MKRFFSVESADVFTIGYSGRKISGLIDILRGFNVKVVVDVRRFPYSKIDVYKRENLERILTEAGFRYVWLGDKLGGYRRGGYASFMNSDEFIEGIGRLIEIIESNVTCILCLEKKPRYCHRRFIAKVLEERGFNVYHII